MRVCYISPYPPIENGIATYTLYLKETMQSLEKEALVVSENGATGRNVFPVFSHFDNDIATRLFHVVANLTPDVVHIQHDYTLYGSDNGVQILDFLYRCKIAGLPTVITLHSLFEELDKTQEVILGSMVDSVSAFIVHEEYQKQTLTRYFPAADKKTHVIPHGIRKITPVKDAKKALDLEGKKVLLLAGYFTPSKGFHRIIKLFPEINKNVKNAVLLISGKMRGLEYANYQQYFFDLINNSPAFENIVVLRGQFPQHTFDTILSASDMMALPYEIGGQSGMLAQASAFHLPVVLSPLKSFVSWNNKTKGGVIAHSDSEYITAISEILAVDNYRRKLKENIKNNITQLYWEEVGKQHILVYEMVINVPYGRARYFHVPEKNSRQ